MSTDTVFTPKAVLLMARIKRQLATRGISQPEHCWSFDSIAALCQATEDVELERSLAELQKALKQKSAPNTWAL